MDGLLEKEIDLMTKNKTKEQVVNWFKIVVYILLSLLAAILGFTGNKMVKSFNDFMDNQNKQQIENKNGIENLTKITTEGIEQSIIRDNELKYDVNGIKGTVNIIKSTLPKQNQEQIERYETLRNEILNEKAESFVPNQIKPLDSQLMSNVTDLEFKKKTSINDKLSIILFNLNRRKDASRRSRSPERREENRKIR